MSTHDSLCQTEHVKNVTTHSTTFPPPLSTTKLLRMVATTKGGEEKTPHHTTHRAVKIARLTRKISYPLPSTFNLIIAPTGGVSTERSIVYGTKVKTTGRCEILSCRNLTYPWQAWCDNFDRERTWYAVRPGVGF